MPTLKRLPFNVNLPWYALNVTLDGQSYEVEMAYNNRADRWSLSLYTSAHVPLILNLLVVIDRDLIAPYKHLALPPGSLICIDTTGNQQQPGLGSFLRTHSMFYLSDA